MPAATGMHSYNTTLWVASFGQANPNGASPAALYTQIADVISINGVPMQSSVTRVTHLTSTNKAHEKVPGFMDGGQVTIRLNHAKGLVAFLAARLPGGGSAPDTSPSWGRLTWVVQFPDGGQWYFTAFLAGMPTEVPEDDRNTVEVTLEIHGRPVFNAV